MRFLDRVSSPRARRIATAVFFAVVLLIHAQRCVRLFTPTSSLFNAEPLLWDDNSMHSFYASVGVELIKRTGQPYGYVPTEMAGHPKTPIYDAAIVPVERMMSTLSFLSPFLVYKLFVLLSMAIVALSPLLGLRLLGMRGLGWAIGWLLLLFHYWWGLGAVFTIAGMNTYLTAASLDLLLLCAVVRLIQRWTWPVATLAGALMCLGPWVHPVSIVVVATSAVALVLLHRGDRKRTVLFVAGVAVLSLLVNRDWISNTISHSEIATPIAEVIGSAQSPLQIARTLKEDVTTAPSLVKATNRAVIGGLDLWLATAAIASLVWLRRQGDARFFPLLAPFVVLGFLTFFSGDIAALQNMQPWRLRYLWLMLVSAIATILFTDWLQSTRWKRLAVAGSAFVAGFYFVAFDAHRQTDRLQIGFTPVQKAWIAELNEMADERARVLVEDGRFYGISPAAFHLGTRTQWVGGPYHLAYVTYHKVKFVNGKLVDRPISQYSETELADFIRRYNVHWVMAWSADSKRTFDARPGLVRRRKEIAGLVFYEVTNPQDSFFERGSGTLSVDLDLLQLRQVKADQGSVVLRYHYYKHLVARGARALRRYAVPGDNIGFIELVDPGPEVTIRSIHSQR